MNDVFKLLHGKRRPPHADVSAGEAAEILLGLPAHAIGIGEISIRADQRAQQQEQHDHDDAASARQPGPIRMSRPPGPVEQTIGGFDGFGHKRVQGSGFRFGFNSEPWKIEP